MLNNRAYIGEAVHKGESYPGEHDAIIDRETWDRVHAILQESPRKRAARTRADTPALLKGLLFGPDGAAFSPTHTRKGDRLYRYYVSQTVLKHGAGSCPVGRVPAGEIEAAVIDQLRAVFRQPEIVAGTWKAARAHADDITEADARAALQQLDPLWDELFPPSRPASWRCWSSASTSAWTGSTSGCASMASVASRARCWPAASRSCMNADADPGDRDASRPIPPCEARRAEGDALAGRRHALAADGQHAGQGAGARVPVEADARVRAIATIADLAAHEGIAPSYMTRVLRLTLLAPDIVDTILEGRQGPDMTLARLMDHRCPRVRTDRDTPQPLGDQETAGMVLRPETVGPALACREVLPS
jgi:hypothetical protein